MTDVIPTELFREVQSHIRDRTSHAEEGWEAGSDEEDTLTGDFGGSLRTGWVDYRKNETGNYWRWRITYKKLRGRGADAPEKETGADGLFQIEVRPDDERRVVTKGVIFQAKKFKSSSRSDLLDQIQKMEQIAPGGSAVFEFGPEGYKGSSRVDILATAEATHRIPHGQESLAEYLADRFLTCPAGLRDMYYDALRHRLIIPTAQGTKIVELRLRHRIDVEVRHNRRQATSGERQFE